MDTPEGGYSVVSIGQFHAQYLISAEHPAPDLLKSRLDGAALKRLPERLGHVLRVRFSDQDPGVWLIRRLEVAVDINAAWDIDQMASAWAVEIGRALEAAMRGTGDGENLFWFPNRAAFLARFLADMAHGSAEGKWQYQTFDGLRSLPASAALRTAICDQAAVGHQALAQLSTADLRRVLNVLTAQDTRRVLNHLSQETPSGEAMPCWRAAWSAWERVEANAIEPAAELRQALHLYILASQVNEAVGGSTSRTAVLGLARLGRCLRQGSAAYKQELLAALTSGDLANLYLTVGTADAELLGPLLHCPPEWVRQVGEALLAGHTRPPAAEVETVSDRRETSLGGIFFLLPLLDELPLVEATHNWPDADEAAVIGLVRLLVLIKCCGQARAVRAFYDPLLRDLLGIPSGLGLRHLAGWQRHIRAQNRESFLETFAHWQRARGAVHGETYLLARAPTPGAPLAILIDGERGMWLFMTALQPQRPAQFARVLRHWLTPRESKTSLLLCDPAWLNSLQAETLPCPVLSLGEAEGRSLAEHDQSTNELLVRLGKLPDDAAHLALPRSFGLAPALDWTLSIAAQGMLRAFAWRLPGFAFSSLPYLHANFLDIAASVEDEPPRRVVHLTKPPLHLVLNMTGMARDTYRLSWLDERPLVLWME